jgi:hypothetical protein
MRPSRALFAIGLGLTAEGMRSNLAASIALTVVKPRDMPLVMYGLCGPESALHYCGARLLRRAD